MKIKPLTPEQQKQARLSVWILAIILSWIVITGPPWLVYEYIVTNIFNVPEISLVQTTASIAGYCIVDLFVFGWKKRGKK